MKNIIEFLEKNNIEHEYVAYGNPYYYNDGFSVQAISIKFDYDLAADIKELEQREKAFLKYMKRKKKCCIGYSGRCGICIRWYSVFNVDDLEKLEEHENRIKVDVEKFWKEEHARRTAENMKVAG